MAYKISSRLHRTFVNNVRARREELDMTQREVAEKMSISQPSYAQIECGRSAPSIEQIEKVANALQTTAPQLLMENAFSVA